MLDKFLNTITCGDSLELMHDIPDNSINLVVTSPPYFNCRSYGNETIGRENHLLNYILK